MSTTKRGTPSKVIIVPRPGNTSNSSSEQNSQEQVPASSEIPTEKPVSVESEERKPDQDGLQ